MLYLHIIYKGRRRQNRTRHAILGLVTLLIHSRWILEIKSAERFETPSGREMKAARPGQRSTVDRGPLLGGLFFFFFFGNPIVDGGDKTEDDRKNPKYARGCSTFFSEIMRRKKGSYYRAE